MYRVLLSIHFLLFLLAVKPVFSQDYPRAKYNWDKNRKSIYQPTEEELKDPAVVVLDARYDDYAESPNPARWFELYITRHKIVHVNDDKGIDRYNKVYIPMEKKDELVTIKARTIDRNGKVTEVNEGSIKDISNYEQYGNFKIFALEGVEKNAELEYFYTIKKEAGGSGTEFFQSDVNIKEASFTLTNPDYLVFATKCYNGFPDLQAGNSGETVVKNASVKDIPALRKESYSNAQAEVMRVSYRYDYNKKTAAVGSLNWKNMIRKLYERYHETDLAISIPKDFKMDSTSEEGKIIAVEKYIKQYVTIHKTDDYTITRAKSVLERRTGSKSDVVNLYVAFFEKLKIPFNMVFTTNRYTDRVDPAFVTKRYFEVALFYFPNSKKFICPDKAGVSVRSRAFEYGDNYGLLIVDADTGWLQKIPLLDVNQTINRLNCMVSFDENMDSVKLKNVQKWVGYRAYGMRGVYNRLKEEGKANYLKTLAFGTSKTDNMLEQNVENIKLEDSYGDEPVKLTTVSSSATLIEHAGNNYIVNVGLLIGRQTELYNQDKRQHEIEMEFPAQELRSIYITIPKGYHVKGLRILISTKRLLKKASAPANSFRRTPLTTMCW